MEGGKFRVKEFDSEGNSVQVFPDVFENEAEATHFIEQKGGKVDAPEADTQDEPEAPEAGEAPVEPEAPAAGEGEAAAPEGEAQPEAPQE